jgi:hypothetical protein
MEVDVGHEDRKSDKRLKQKVGELVLDVDILKEAMRGRPFGRATSDE